MKQFYLLILILLLFYCNLVSAQTYNQVFVDEFEFKKDDKGYKEAWKKIAKAEEFFSQGKKGAYLKALDLYLEAYNYNPENPELNYKIGFCYLETIQKAAALKYIDKAYFTKPNISEDIKWLRGKALKYNYKFQEAKDLFIEFKSLLKGTDLQNYKKLIEKQINECETGIILMQKPQNVVIKHIDGVNSKYPDYCPLITADESVLYFTSRREGSSEGRIDKNDGQPFEDIYVSYKEDTVWSEPENAGYQLNTKAHDATVGLSPDGQDLLIYREGDLFISKLKGEEWEIPVKLPEQINTLEVENSACFSPDGKSIYFIRGRTGDPKTSNGDIFVTTLKQGKWSQAKSLGNVLNTPYDEDGVYMHPDGKTLYFSSKGHETMGGFDIFKTTLNENGTWTKPQNLGFPVNSPDDDVYFVLSADGKTGYYSSVKQDALGFTDIYTISFNDIFVSEELDSLSIANNDTLPENSLPVAQTVKLIVVKGTVYDLNSKEPVDAEIEIVDNEKNEVIYTVSSNKKTGKYLVTLPSGKNYGLAVKADNYLFHSENFDLDSNQTFQTLVKDIDLVQVNIGGKVVLKNIFFEYDRSKITKESTQELDRLKFLLNQYKDIRIEVSGHTDNFGSAQYNKNLSEQRAKAVVDYLISKGINRNRLEYRGVGFDEPIATNNTEEGRKLNRRVEVKIIK